MRARYCRHGHLLARCNVYLRPNGATDCWVCKLRERWSYWAARGAVYRPGPSAAAKIDELRAEGVWVQP